MLGTIEPRLTMNIQATSEGMKRFRSYDWARQVDLGAVEPAKGTVLSLV